ncbi:hypothetical protein BD626DRAFT_483705 [Schizophyllum amplum]|uniref:Uncharacterized protein n=1 Tax=Schizophyllum amplum TaxID=97359 RepID=A0A550CPN4_9AGAR|nr:hypothetical protein BD626DRAFT_483705 [Auriculariopsis ampla]
MALAKDKHYWGQLRSALTGGNWESNLPAKAPNATALSWSELFRKFNKHCTGHRDVAEVASQTHALALLLLVATRKSSGSDEGPVPALPIAIDGECVLPEGRRDDARQGLDVLQKLHSTNSNMMNHALAYYAYALGDAEGCIAYLDKIPDIGALQSSIPTASATDGLGPSLQDGRAWALTEAMRSICIKGMAYESLHPGDHRSAIQQYAEALPLLSLIKSELTISSTPSSTGAIDFSSFTRYRELWRWVDRLLWRAIVLVARCCDVLNDDMTLPESLWTWLNHYSAVSAFWPPDFHSEHRSTICVLYLRSLVLKHGQTSNESTNLPSTSAPGTKPPPWVHIARVVIQEYHAILTASSKFPRAGERNTRVEDFVDLCVAVWETSGAYGDHAGWVIDILWWATRLTFNSFRIYRHMTRLFYVSGDPELAKRTLRLYVQVVSKAHQASDAGVGADADTDRQWVETLASGARMLCDIASSLPGLEGVELVREAGTLVEKAKTRLAAEEVGLAASIALAEGVYNSILALKEQNPHFRPERFASAHKAFMKSVELCGTPAGFFHLAVSLARPSDDQDLDAAISYTAFAMEGDPKEIRYWHLMALLLSAKEQWQAARAIVEEAEQIGEPQPEPIDGLTPIAELPTVEDGSTIDGLPSSSTARPYDKQPIYALGDEAEVPSSDDLLKPALDHPPPSQQDLLEHSLQLRMTQIALTEYMDGPEGAAEQGVEIFQWVAEKRNGSTDSQRRASLDVRRSQDLHSTTGMSTGGHSARPTVKPSGQEAAKAEDDHTANSSSIPITVSPATPSEQSHPPLSAAQEKIAAENPLPDRLSGGSRLSDRHSTHSRSRPKRMQQALKDRVHQGHARLSTISKKLGSGVVRNGSLKRSRSAPDFDSMLRPASAYQASSIHSRRRVSAMMSSPDLQDTQTPMPPPPALPPIESNSSANSRTARERRLLSDLWLMSAATFRRLDKIEQARGAIQEAEVRDENNPAVWVQLGLYYTALGRTEAAVESLQKALFISPDDVPASIHLCRLYLSEEGLHGQGLESDSVDLAAGILTRLSKTAGWDVPEVWFYLARAAGYQGQKARQRECLTKALKLSEKRGVREIGAALGWCL